MKNAVFAFAVAFSLIHSLSANIANIWQAVDGDYNGKYSDSRHWSLGHIPDCNNDEDAVFINDTGKQYDVEIDVDLGEDGIPMPKFFKVSDNGVKTENLSAVRFFGSGKIQQKSDSVYFYRHSHAIFDGDVKFEIPRDFANANYTNRVVEVRGNANIAIGGAFVMDENNKFVISGGRISMSAISVPESAPVTFLMTGGELTVSDMPDFSESSTLEFSGGKIVQTGGKLTETRLLPKGDAVYDHVSADIHAVTCNAPTTNELSGALFVTNINSSARGWVRFDGGNTVVYGGGEISAQTFYLGGTVGNVFDISRLNVGHSIYITESGEVTFPDNVTVGAFGDHVSQSTDNYKSHYFDRVTFETTDCFDGTTARNVKPGGLMLTPGSEICVTGTGSAKLTFNSKCGYTSSSADMSPALRSFEISGPAEGGLTSDNNGVLRVGALLLNGTATLSVCPTKNSIDSASAFTAEEAKIKVDVAGLTATDTVSNGSLVHPVVVSGGGNGVPLGNVSIINNSGTWKAKKVGGCIYLRDGTPKMEVTTAPYLWTGSVNGDWKESGNWYGRNVPDSSSRVFFGVCDTTNIVTVPAEGVTVTTLCGGGYTGSAWFRSSEPYIFRGGKISISRSGNENQNAGFFDCGKLPKRFECDVEFTGDTAVVLPYKSVAFLGGFSAKNLTLRGGDLRFGGTANVQNIAMKSYFATGCRNSCLTVISGGSFAVSAANCTVGTTAHLQILGGGSMTIDGSRFAYEDAPTITNIVDGTLTINAPYGINTDQCFAGTGRVDIASTYSGASISRQMICGRVRLNIGNGFRTVTSDNVSGAVALSVPDFREATLGLTSDATYGPADGVAPETAASDRALYVGYRSKLTIDTKDPDSGVAHTLTFKDPIVGGGNLTIAGNGKVVLATEGNRVGKLSLVGGTLTASIPGEGWMDVITADSIEGLAGHGDPNLKFKIAENADGSVTLSASRRHGTTVIIR